jgi:endonuclease G
MRAIPTLVSTLLFAVSLTASAANPTDFRDCPQFFAAGKAPSAANLDSLRPRALCFDAFAVLHSGTTKTPVFVAEKLNRSQLLDAKGEERHDKFFAEARLPSADRAQLADFQGSGFDRGHLAPAADMPNATAMAQSFSLANMVPQAPTNNRKTWAGIEKATRKFALRAGGDVYVISGPVFVQPVREIGPGKVRVPSHLFKLVYDASSGRAWAHWLENTNEAHAGKPITYQELVRRTGIELLPGVTVKGGI